MKRFSISGALGALLLLAAGCGMGSDYKYDAQGAPYEIVVVADHDVWESPAGDSIRTMFYRRFPMINREETAFDVLRVLPAGFKQLNMRHRNVLLTSLEPGAEPSLKVGEDFYAKPQTVITATAPDAAALARLIGENRDNILLLLENAEKDRDVAASTGHTPTQIASLVKEKFGFEMSTGPGYTVRGESEDFLWMSYEMPAASQGVVIYAYPFSGTEDFNLGNLLVRRDEFVKRIPAENPGSHMATNPDPGFGELVYKTIDGRPWAEMSGFWDTVGDFMGGPYRNYSTFDVVNGRIIAVDFYVYSPNPRFMQRNYIKQLEHLLYTVKIPEVAPAGDGTSASGGEAAPSAPETTPAGAK